MPEPNTPPHPPTTQPKRRSILGIAPIKLIFAMEYVLQGLANPFLGVTYQPFYNHFRNHYGLGEAATEQLFAKSYLAWSFKPLIGILLDAYGRTRTVLIVLLTMVTAGFLLVPLIDRGYLIFFGVMFALSVIIAATDVSVDRATVIQGEAETLATGKSKATTISLNQAICWTAIYGTGIVSAVIGGWAAEHIQLSLLLRLLSILPFLTLLIVLTLPKEQSVRIPLRRSILNFWDGLNSGKVLWIFVFFFVFHFQPTMGVLWNNHLIENLHFSQSQIGIAEGAYNLGNFVGVLLFVMMGIRWQERIGLKKLFRIYIAAEVVISLTQYTLVDPWFTQMTTTFHTILPFSSLENLRLGCLIGYNFLLTIPFSLIRMSIFGLVGAVIPVAAAGSLFAGFMSVIGLAYSFSYASSAWIYTHGMNWEVLRNLQATLFGIVGKPGDNLAISMLILIGSLAYLLSYVATHILPDRKETITGVDGEKMRETPLRWLRLPKGQKRSVDILSLVLGSFFFVACILIWKLDPVSTVLLTFFGFTFLRKLTLDWLLRRAE
jgi:MFS family permease